MTEINYVPYVRVSNATTKRWTLKREDVNTFKFQETGFFENLKGLEFVRPYFDFDELSSREEYDEVVDWLDSLSEIFGEYSLAGYTDDVEMSELGFRFNPEGNHFLSVHAVFYTVRIKQNELAQIMRWTEKKGFTSVTVNKHCDHEVYKTQDKRQLMRMMLSPKWLHPPEKDVNGENKDNWGYILRLKKPETQIITPAGDERVVGLDDWDKLTKRIERENAINQLVLSSIDNITEKTETKKDKKEKLLKNLMKKGK